MIDNKELNPALSRIEEGQPVYTQPISGSFLAYAPSGTEVYLHAISGLEGIARGVDALLVAPMSRGLTQADLVWACNQFFTPAEVTQLTVTVDGLYTIYKRPIGEG